MTMTLLQDWDLCVWKVIHSNSNILQFTEIPYAGEAELSTWNIIHSYQRWYTSISMFWDGDKIDAEIADD